MYLYLDRLDAGQQLAGALNRYRGWDDVLVLGLPRGGVQVASQVAEALGAPLDVMLVRKLGVPGHEELAMGAIASGGARVLNAEVIRSMTISDDVFNDVLASEQGELARRERAYRGDRPRVQLAGRVVILVDDGLATGATMRAAVAAVRQSAAGRVVVAVPVAAPAAVRLVAREVDEVVCLAAPELFCSVGQWYEDFAQTTDQEVRDLLEASWQRPVSAGCNSRGQGLGARG